MLAKLGESAAGKKSSLWKYLVSKVRRFLLKHFGVSAGIDESTVADLVADSLKRLMCDTLPTDGNKRSFIEGELAAQYSRGELFNFWKGFKDVDSRGSRNDAKLQAFITQGYSTGGRGGVRNGQLSEHEGFLGRETMFFNEPIAGFDGYFTTARVGQTEDVQVIVEMSRCDKLWRSTAHQLYLVTSQSQRPVSI